MDQDELWLKVSYVRENVQTGQTITCITEVCKYLEIALGFTGQNDNWIGTILMIGNSSQAVPVNQLQSWFFFLNSYHLLWSTCIQCRRWSADREPRISSEAVHKPYCKNGQDLYACQWRWSRSQLQWSKRCWGIEVSTATPLNWPVMSCQYNT